MDEPDNTFFSKEALRLLETDEASLDEQTLGLLSSWDTSVIDSSCGAHSTTAAAAPECQKSVPTLQHSAESAYSIFPTKPDQGQKRKRAKFEDPRRRDEVAQIRKQGACLRCRWTKSPVR